MLFMTKMILLIVCLCATIQFNQAQPPKTLLSCTFDEANDDCGFYDADGKQVFSISKGAVFNESQLTPPALPLSDVTSVCT